MLLEFEEYQIVRLSERSSGDCPPNFKNRRTISTSMLNECISRELFNA